MEIHHDNEKPHTPLSISVASGQFQIVWDAKNIKETITFFPQHYILTPDMRVILSPLYFLRLQKMH